MEIIELLRKKENKIIKLISELEDISKNDPHKFDQFVSIRKDKNKENKLNSQKENQKYSKIYLDLFIILFYFYPNLFYIYYFLIFNSRWIKRSKSK